MRIKKLLNILDISYPMDGIEDFEIRELQIDSNKVKNNDIFFCIKGYLTDGHKYAYSAIENGAKCVFVEKSLNINNVIEIVVDDTRELLAKASVALYDNPSSKMNVIGITGTNGKTTTAHIVSHVLHNVIGDCLLVGTTGIEFNEKDTKEFEFLGRTTPESHQLQKMLNILNNDGVKNLVMEVSSHALYLKRVAYTNYAVTAFTNLSQDHLDFHKTMDNYFETKKILFSQSFPAKRVICIDTKWGEKLADFCMKNNDDVLTVGFNQKAMLNISDINFKFPLVGKFNLQNMLVAYGICRQLGLNDDDIIKSLKTCPSTKGRLEYVGTYKNRPRVFVDYAHTPDGLKNILQTLRDELKNEGYSKSRLICLFGCGGDRDKDKRPMMAKVAQDNADFCIITSDNPRSENPESILDDIEYAMKGSNYARIVDRREAIAELIKMSNVHDIVVIAGKGHEKTQTIGDKVIPFDDVMIAREYLLNSDK